MASRWLMMLAALLFAVAAQATENPATLYTQGRQLYAAGNFTAAVTALKKAAQADAYNSEYEHWLGKAYGRLAQKSSWLSAISLAEKARDALKRAVQLDPNNSQAIADLIQYYRSAPGFLGGSAVKADKLEQRLEMLQGKAQNETIPRLSRSD